jgi:hypothetical protein
MPQSTSLYVGMDVHQESIAVAYVAQDRGVEVVFLGYTQHLYSCPAQHEHKSCVYPQS